MPRAKLAKLSLEDLKKEIVRRTSVLPKLIAMRTALDKKIAELQDLGAAKPAAKAARKVGRKARRRAIRAARPGSLRSALAEVLTGTGKMSVAELVAAVRAAGYKTKSKVFPKVVGLTLSKDKQFQRVSRGVYKLRG